MDHACYVEAMCGLLLDSDVAYEGKENLLLASVQ